MNLTDFISILALIISGMALYFTVYKNRQDLQQPLKNNAYKKLIDAISFQEKCIKNNEKDKFPQAASDIIDAMRHLTIIAPHKILFLCHELRNIKIDTKETVEKFEKIREKILHEIRKDLKVNKTIVDISKLIK